MSDEFYSVGFVPQAWLGLRDKVRRVVIIAFIHEVAGGNASFNTRIAHLHSSVRPWRTSIPTSLLP